MKDFRWRLMIAELRREFGARGMRRNLAKLDAFSRGYEQQLKRLSAIRDPPWTSEVLVMYAAALQIPPFQDYFPVAPRDGRCPHCRAEVVGLSPGVVHAMVGDRTVYACRTCEGQWLAIKGEAEPR